jgi:hypothetical protein
MEDSRMQGSTEEPQGPETATEDAKAIDLVIVYGINKPVSIDPRDTIATLKLKALEAFGIPASEAGNYYLSAKVHGDQEERLKEDRTVESYHLHDRQKVTLAATNPFGSEA